MAQTAYAASAAPTRTDRGMEYEAFARATSAMRTANAEGKRGFPALARALDDNRRLWVLMATNVADRDNRLPQQLRAQIFYLAEFSLQHTSKVLAGEATADVLIDINTAVMRGLRDREPGK